MFRKRRICSRPMNLNDGLRVFLLFITGSVLFCYCLVSFTNLALSAKDMTQTLRTNTKPDVKVKLDTIPANLIPNISSTLMFDFPYNHSIYLITPTYTRSTQLLDLTKMGNTLAHIPNIIWIIIEDSATKTGLVARFLARSRVKSVHLNIKMGDNLHSGARGSPQATLGILWLRHNQDALPDGMVYFADDDNTYSTEIFAHCLATVHDLVVWPVAFAGGMLLEGPHIINDTIAKWNVGYEPFRAVPIDMAGFGVSLARVLGSNATFLRVDIACRKDQPTIDEACFLKNLNLNTVHAKPCQSEAVLVWHVKSHPSTAIYTKYKGANDDLGMDV